jgi:hypothetical protein
MPNPTNPYRFLLFGLTYLLSTPSHFAKLVVDASDNIPQDVRKWLISAKVTDTKAQDAAIKFIQTILADPSVYSFMNGMRAAVQGPFSTATGLYDGHACPGSTDSQRMIEALSKL